MKINADLSSIDFKDLLERIKNSKKVFWFLGSHVFFVILVLIFLDIIFGGFLLYRYAVFAKIQDSGAPAQDFRFAESAYKNVLIELQTREQKFEEAQEQNYPDPFAAKIK